MAKLYFRYSTMNAGKSLDLLKVAHNYEELNKDVIILTSALDDRYGKNKVASRIGIKRDAVCIKPEDNLYHKVTTIVGLNDIDVSNIGCILIDEVQFFTKKQIYDLSIIVDELKIPVICYGLRSDFKHEPFEGSMYLMAIADEIEEMKTICWCGKKATCNARLIDGKVIKDGDQVQIGGNESYIALCRKHYNLNIVKI